jgi:hypothetical protein
MYNESALVTRINTITGYNTVLADEMNLNLNALDGVTKIYVEHAAIKLQHPENFWRDGYEEYDIQQVLLTKIHILCARANFATVRTNVYNSYANWSPVQDANYSRLAFIEGNVAIKGADNLWYTETIGSIFPSIT